MAKKTVADYAQEFTKRARAGSKPRVSVSKAHAETFLMFLAREGFGFARAALDQISDPEVRRVVETIFFATAAGVGAGAAIGFLIAGPAGAQVGAAVGGGVGMVAGCVAVTLSGFMRGEELVLQAE